MSSKISIPLLALAGLACSPAQEVAPPADQAKSEDAERIDDRNDPSLFRLEMVRRFADLPTAGESTRKPFPSNWWPMRHGGAARRWYQNEPAPTEKYDQLVHPDQIEDVELTLAQKNWKDEPVNEDAEPETFHIGPATEWELTKHGRYGDVDPDSWWGHCNGWASYTLNEDEPIREVWVRMNGNDVEECRGDTTGCILFRLGDINALGAELYWIDAARMLGRRCEQQSSEFEFDEAGRINNVDCRDGNAGAFHIIAANMIGVMQRPFILDLNANFEVWNYPVYRFELTRNDDLTLDEALAEIGAPEGTATWIYNEDAVSFRRVQMRAWIVEDAIPPTNEPAGDDLDRYTTLETYDYVLELDAAGDIVGGEWIGRSKTDHADFVWFSYSNDRYDAYGADDRWDSDNPHLRYSIFEQILTLAQSRPEPPPGGDVLRLSSRPDLAIPDDDPTGSSDTITVDESFAVTSVGVTLDVTHTYRGDLTVLLSHGDRQFTLRSPSGGSQHDLHERYSIDATGADATGDWTLTVVDGWAQDTGTIDGWTLELTRPKSGGGGTTVTKQYSASPNVSIPDDDPTGVTDTLTIDDDIQISELSVTVDITHTWIGDLVITLSNGTATQTLHDRAGGSQHDLRKTFPTLAFQNAGTRGNWTLKVTDNAGRDTGTLKAWSIEVTGTER